MNQEQYEKEISNITELSKNFLNNEKKFLKEKKYAEVIDILYDYCLDKGMIRTSEARSKLIENNIDKKLLFNGKLNQLLYSHFSAIEYSKLNERFPDFIIIGMSPRNNYFYRKDTLENQAVMRYAINIAEKDTRFKDVLSQIKDFYK